MHICHVIDSLALGGAERMAVEIANATQARGARVSVCTTRSGGPFESFLSSGVEKSCLGRTGRFDLSAARRFGEFCRREEVSVLHIHGVSSFFFCLGARMFGLKVPQLLHDHFGDVELSPTRPTIVRWAVGSTKPAYVGVHPQLVEEARRWGVPDERSWFVDNALDLESYRALPPACAPRAGHPLRALCIANIRPSKDILMLIEAVARLQDSSVQVGVVGSYNDAEYHRSCLERIEALGLGDQVLLAGPTEDVSSELARADIGLVPSRSESGPLVVVEHLAAGRPVVATAVGNIGRSAQADGVPGFVAPGDPDAFAAALDELRTLSTQDWRSRVELGQRWAVEHYGIEARMSEWCEIYRQAREAE